jgi:hypothetical protein
MIYLLAFIIIYILSAWRVWWWIRMAHYHPKGSYYNHPIDNDDYWVTFLPILNTLFSLLTLYIGCKTKEYDNKNNIFKPKKPLT